MKNFHTDLAIERDELYRNTNKLDKTEGISVEISEDDKIKCTRVIVENSKGEMNINKPIGRYITIESPMLIDDNMVYEKTCCVIASEIKKLYKNTDGAKTLVIGLGNRNVTPDSLGCETVENVMITRHMIEYMPNAVRGGIESVCAISPGVLGTTGIESADIITSLSRDLTPDCVIVIDALAALDYKRLGTTIQINNTGIQPGAGVGNNRHEISEKTLGCKVIAIGVPTVIEARVIAQKNSVTNNSLEPLIVTPRNIDVIIEKTSKTIANGINIALHKNITFSEIEDYIG